MAAEIQREDLISDDAIMAPLVLNRNFETLYDTMIKLKTEFGQSAAFAKQATSINAVGTSIEKLVTTEKEMVKLQNQLATAVAKDTHEYAELKKKVDEATRGVSKNTNPFHFQVFAATIEDANMFDVLRTAVADTLAIDIR